MLLQILHLEEFNHMVAMAENVYCKKEGHHQAGSRNESRREGRNTQV